MSLTRKTNEQGILHSWERNATPWTAAVREEKIESRKAVTNAAVLEAIGPGEGRSVLDLGCGEGWLSRDMSRQGWRVVGVDGSASLIEAARVAGPENYLCLDYFRLGAELSHERFDLVVCNFSLLGEESTNAALCGAARMLNPGGRLLIQTVHPITLEGAYRSGWRTEDWVGLGRLECSPTPWYFHTLSEWVSLLRETGFTILDIREPIADGANRPSSLILVAERGWRSERDE